MKNFSKLISSLGIQANYNGFDYLFDALNLCFENEEYLHNICKGLYAEIGAKHNTTIKNVEQCIRTVIENCWNNGNKKLLMELAGYELHQRPTNAEFIAILYQHLSSNENDPF